MAYWYDVATGTVQQDGATDPKATLMGPYDTAEDAQRALETAAQKTAAWDQEDREWEQGGSAGDDS